MTRYQKIMCCMIVSLIGILSGCQAQNSVADVSATSSQMQDVDTKSDTEDTTSASDLSESVPDAMEQISVLSSDQKFEVEQAPWGCTLEEMGNALHVDFYETAVLSGADNGAFLSAKPVNVFGTEATVQAEVYQEKVRALSFRIEAGDTYRTVYDKVKEEIEQKCGAPVRESDTDSPQKISIWEQKDTSLVLVLAGQEIRMNAGENLDTRNINPVALEAEDLKQESGEYGIASIPWGSESTVAPEALGIRFYDIPTFWNETLTAYPSRDSCKILGYAARVTAEYKENGLYQLTFTLDAGDEENDFTNLLQELESKYGECSAKTENADANRTSYRWGSVSAPGTALILSKTAGTICIDLIQL